MMVIRKRNTMAFAAPAVVAARPSVKSVAFRNIVHKDVWSCRSAKGPARVVVVPESLGVNRVAAMRSSAARRMMSVAEPETPRKSNLERGESLPEAQPDWKIKLLYDSECVLCMREVNFLQRRDLKNNILFVDIAGDDYSPEDNAGLSYSAAMRRIHGILRDGTVLEGVPVFRKVYEEIGLGWVYAITKVPIFGFLAGKLYDVWADYRLRLTGRKDLAELVREREQRLKDASCEQEECAVPE